jgi:hypothetical protein
MTFSCSWGLDISGEGIPEHHYSSARASFSCRETAASMLNFFQYRQKFLVKRDGVESVYSNESQQRSYQFILRFYDSIRVSCITTKYIVGDIDCLLPLIADNFPGMRVEVYTQTNGLSEEKGFFLSGGAEVHNAFYWAQLLLRVASTKGSDESVLKHLSRVPYGNSTYNFVSRCKDMRKYGALGLVLGYGPDSLSRLEKSPDQYPSYARQMYLQPPSDEVNQEIDALFVAYNKSRVSLKNQKVQGNG